MLGMRAASGGFNDLLPSHMDRGALGWAIPHSGCSRLLLAALADAAADGTVVGPGPP